jgi:hypothetical protein
MNPGKIKLTNMSLDFSLYINNSHMTGVQKTYGIPNLPVSQIYKSQ